MHKKIVHYFFSLTILFLFGCTKEAKTPLFTEEKPSVIGGVEYRDFILPKLVKIKAGSFNMGSGRPNQSPIHLVNIEYDFYMGATEVTLGEYYYCVKDVYCRKPKADRYFKKMCLENDCPVQNISWYDAKDYTVWLSGKTGHFYRLPTEAEWEYAVRAGTDTKWFFGDDQLQAYKYAWAYSNSEAKIHPVGLLEPNPWGLYDVYGNVAEWCEDWYTKSYKNTPSDGSANMSGEQERRIYRSSGYGSVPFTSTTRFSMAPNLKSTYHGFRIVRIK